MTAQQTPALILGLTVATYWGCVLRMVLRTARNARRAHRLLVPAQRRERLMWLVWVPLVAAWMTLPLLAAFRAANHDPWTSLPGFVLGSGLVTTLRWLAAALALVCLVWSLWCWTYMGRDWRMAVDPRAKSELLTGGPFAIVRHPIYAVSILLMLCTVASVPTFPVLLMAAAHVLLMQFKARNEERFLLGRFGQTYADYARGTGRFLPSRLWLAGFREVGRAYRSDPGAGNTADQGCLPPGVQAMKLNAFQETMLLWEHLHPYNAVHAVRLDGLADVPALRQTIEHVCRTAGIGDLALDPSTGRYGYLPLSAVPVRELAATDDPDETLAQVIDEEMNSAFPGGPQHPLRWTVISLPDEHAHEIVLAYHHVASDAHGIERLLGAVVARYSKLLPLGEPIRLTTAAPEMSGFGGDRIVGWRTVRNVARAVALYFRLRFSHRMPDEKGAGDRTHALLAAVPPDVAHALPAACKAAGVGMNDIMLAALARAIAERTPDRYLSRRRRRLTLASAVSLRRRAGEDSSNCFGTFLGDMLVLIHQPDAPLPTLIAQVTAQTRGQKRSLRRAAAAARARLFCVRHIWPLFRLPHERRSYRKISPVCGGVTTVVVNLDHFGPAAGRVQRYLRACPPGPAMPIVLAPTRFQGQLTLSLVCREACMDRDRATGMLHSVIAALRDFVAPSPRDNLSWQRDSGARRAGQTPARERGVTQPVAGARGSDSRRPGGAGRRAAGEDGQRAWRWPNNLLGGGAWAEGG